MKKDFIETELNKAIELVNDKFMNSKSSYESFKGDNMYIFKSKLASSMPVEFTYMIEDGNGYGWIDFNYKDNVAKTVSRYVDLVNRNENGKYLVIAHSDGSAQMLKAVERKPVPFTKGEDILKSLLSLVILSYDEEIGR